MALAVFQGVSSFQSLLVGSEVRVVLHVSATHLYGRVREWFVHVCACVCVRTCVRARVDACVCVDVWVCVREGMGGSVVEFVYV